jgi:hypothetical protein
MRTKTFQMKWLTVAALLVALGLGCGEKGPEAISRLNPRSASYLEGVPVPEGFKLVGRESTDYESGGQRSALHVYEGWADPAAIRSFYREQMPMMGWGKVSDQSVEGVATLRFEKSNEACTVDIKPTGLLNRTKIHVTVSPFNRARTTTEPPRRSVP